MSLLKCIYSYFLTLKNVSIIFEKTYKKVTKKMKTNFLIKKKHIVKKNYKEK